jgi:hypothetical protein
VLGQLLEHVLLKNIKLFEQLVQFDVAIEQVKQLFVHGIQVLLLVIELYVPIVVLGHSVTHLSIKR